MRQRRIAVFVVLTAVVAGLALLGGGQQRSNSRRDAPDEVAVEAGVPAAVSEDSKAPAKTRVVQIRDLADGRPVGNVRVRVGSSEVPADEDGWVRVPAAEGPEPVFSLASGNWTSLARADNDPMKTGVLWVHGWLHVRGTVRGRGDPGALDFGKVRIGVLLDGLRRTQRLPDANFLRRVLSPHRFKPGLSTQGTFELRTPRISSVTVTASASGWRPAHATVDVSRRIERADVELFLEPAFRIRGILRSSEGIPLVGVRVSVHSIVRATPDEIKSGNLALLQPRGGFTGSVDLITGRAVAEFESGGWSGKDGRFDIPVTVNGEALLLVFARGHRPVERDLGSLQGDHDLDLTATRIHESSHLRFEANDKPVVTTRGLIADLSMKSGDMQPGRYFTTDKKGRIVTDWLTKGRRYYFDVAGHSGHVIWNGQRTIDLARDLQSVSTLPR